MLKLNPASNDVTVTSIAIIDDVHSKKYSGNNISVIETGGIYVAFANEIVRDASTGLEWKVGPDKDTTWNEARSWVQSLNLDGGGWRMPTMNELGTLYKKSSGSRNITPLLKTSGWVVWALETKGSSGATHFSFIYGGRFWPDSNLSANGRAFAVRSRNDG